MEKISFAKNGTLRLPPGFRFHPTDEELVVQYLMRKVLSHPLPASIIPEVDVCKSDPWDLPGDSEQERYFFSTRETKYRNGNRSNRATGSGYWKATGLDKPIVSSTINRIVGMKKTLVFYRGKPPKGSRTDWVMHEYRLQSSNRQQSDKEDWVLCRIFLKRRNNKNGTDKESHHNEKEANTGLVFYDFMAKERAALNNNNINDNSCTGSSGITSQISNKNGTSEDHEEESSSCDSFNTNCVRMK